MSHELRIINPLDIPDWDEQVLRLPNYSFFHSAAWAKVLSEAYKYKPTYFTFFEDNKLTALLPAMDVNSILTGHRGISLPFTDFCEPIADSNLNFRTLFEHAVSHGKKSGWKYIELRGGQTFLPDTVPSQTFLAHTMDLFPDEKKIMNNFRDSTRRNIKKAITEGVTVNILNTREAVKEFCRLNCLTRKEHGLPPQPGKFFQAIYKHIISKGHGFVALAYFQGKAIAGNIYFHFGEKAVYKYGASNKTWQHLRASNLVMWEAIRWYCRKGCEQMHFGRTEEDHQGLRQFKMGWGVQEHAVSYSKYDLRKGNFVKQKNKVTFFQNSIFCRMPVPLLKITGSLFYGHMA